MSEPNATLEVVCKECHEHHFLKISVDEYAAWRGREKLLQDAFPHLTPGERELIKSDICDTCFKKMFKPYESTT